MTSPAAASLAVTGYAETGTDPALVNASAPALATLGIDGVNIAADGASVTAPDSSALDLLNQARAKHLRAEFLVGNFSSSLGDFDPAAAHRLLASTADTGRVVAVLAGAVASQGWDGVTVDLESLTGADRAGLVRFVAALKNALPKGRTVSVDVTACTDAQQYLDDGYDLPGLARAADRIVLMAYDQHGPTWTGAGPIGGLPWQRQTLTALLAAVPAAKTDLGVAGYGYTWPASGTGDQVTDAEARRRVSADGATARWDAGQGEWTAKLRNGTAMWWSDAKSWPSRVAMAKEFRLHGLALWSLGQSDPVR